MRGDPGDVKIMGGVVSWQNGERLRLAIKSLTSQILPPAVSWTEIRVAVVETDIETVHLARSLAEADTRVRVFSERERAGKSSALAMLLNEPSGQFTVLLNGDAIAAPGAITGLLAVASKLPRGPRAVTSRPIPTPVPPGAYGVALEILWELHHDFHTIIYATRKMRHLSDELLLLENADCPKLPQGIVNDGAFMAMKIVQSRGSLGYAPVAQVYVAVPKNFIEHLHQRRRIQAGHIQVKKRFRKSQGNNKEKREGAGTLVAQPPEGNQKEVREADDPSDRFPATFSEYALKNPRVALSLLRGRAREHQNGFAGLALVLIGEAIASTVAFWDSLPPVRSHTLWRKASLVEVAK